jgi:hypothetical protein
MGFPACGFRRGASSSGIPAVAEAAQQRRHLVADSQTPCFKLEGKFANVPTTLWLDKATYLLVRMVQDTDLTLCTTVYSPQVDIEIPATELEFNAPGTR